jgi:putative membrane protein
MNRHLSPGNPRVRSEWHRTVIRVLLNAAALGLTASLFESIRLGGLLSAVLAVVLLAFSNVVIRPVFVLLTLPLTILTLGLFTLVINAALFKITSLLVPGFQVGGFWSALGGALVYSILVLLINGFFLPPERGPRITFHYWRF